MAAPDEKVDNQDAEIVFEKESGLSSWAYYGRKNKVKLWSNKGRSIALPTAIAVVIGMYRKMT